MVKTGRKRQHWTGPSGKTYVGLSHTGGRWRCQDCRQFLPKLGKAASESQVDAAWHRHRSREHAEHDAKLTVEHSAISSVLRGFTLTGGELGGQTAEQRLWDWVAGKIRSEPKRIAKLTGIEEISYLSDLQPPKASPTLQSLGERYAAKSSVTKHERQKVGRYWQTFIDFMASQGINDASDVGHSRDVVAQWGNKLAAKVAAGDMSAKTANHYVAGVRTVLNYAQRQGLDVDAAIAAMTVIEKLAEPPTNPTPIERQTLHKLLDHADDDMTLAILGMLNLCMYPSELLALDRQAINDAGEVVGHRNKTGIVRTGVLWKRTKDALPSRDGPLIRSKTGSRMKAVTLRKRFEKLRETAGVDPSVKLDQLRDGAYSAAVAAGVNEQHCKVLAGHKSGMTDNYVKRQPQMVKAACEAIEAKYFG